MDVVRRECGREQRAKQRLHLVRREGLAGLSPKNAQSELYLTDVVALAAKQGRVETVVQGDMGELRGVNTRADLALCEEALRARLIAAASFR